MTHLHLDERLDLEICFLDTRSSSLSPCLLAILFLIPVKPCCCLCHTPALPCLAALPGCLASVEDSPFFTKSFRAWPPNPVNAFFLSSSSMTVVLFVHFQSRIDCVIHCDKDITECQNAVKISTFLVSVLSYSEPASCQQSGTSYGL